MSNSRIVIVTGASSGIGRATSLRLADRGDHLVLMARGRERLLRVAAECRDAGAASVVVHAGDVADEETVSAIFADTVAAHGRVDGVVNSAGVAAYGWFSEIPADVLERVLATNLVGTANVGRAALRQFRSQGNGRIVFVGSLLGKIVAPFMSPYATSKWGVHALVRTMQIEARTLPGVGVSLVSPGGVQTPIYAWSASMSGRRGQPPPPVDPPEKVARAIVKVLDRPRRETSVGIANPIIVLGFRTMPGVFDRLVTPLMSTFGLDRSPVAETRGNLFEPQPDPVTPYGASDPKSVQTIRDTANRLASLVSRTSLPLPYPGTPPTTRESSDDGSPGGRDLTSCAVVERLMSASPTKVWATLSDGWLYASWVVGASRTREVDDEWPAVGSKIHHSFGIWPAVINDTTEVLRADDRQRLRLRARGGRLGDAEVDITLTPVEGGSTLVRIQEDAVAGPGRVTPRLMRQSLMVPRNKEALRRLAFLAERR